MYTEDNVKLSDNFVPKIPLPTLKWQARDGQGLLPGMNTTESESY